MATILIRDYLVSPPTWFASFRDLTLFCATFYRDDVLIESPNPDPFYHWLKPRGGMDFIEDFVRPGSEDGIRLDFELNYPRTVLTDRITPENVQLLLFKLGRCRTF